MDGAREDGPSGQFDGVEFGAEFGAALDGVRVVGMGESTHGTAEFFRLKHRIFEYLVVEHGFRTFAMEASASAGPAVDAYVRGGAGDGAAVLTGLGFWVWRTREVLDLLEWMRDYNRGRPRAEQVGFVGIDPQRCGASLAHFGEERAGVLAALAEAYPGQLPERREELLTAAKALEAGVRGSGEIPEAGGHEALEAAGRASAEDRRHARILLRAADVVTREPGAEMWRARDGFMADGVDEAVAAGGGAGVAVWAHNGHIGVRGAALGARLRERYGSAYYALGLVFGEGAFRARRMWPGPWRPRVKRPSPVAVNRLGPAREGTLEALLAARAPGTHLVDLRSRADEPWVTETHLTRTHGAYVSRLTYRWNVAPTVPGAEYDGLAYVPVSTPSRPL
ncbi:erythromycin esterase family protein [Streptomyces sp. NBC_01077]|uniref:erythromycin esterase family protein n=1 Tax=Streptomyces sp. NBC_01077 TaxID=2903746 RepID=UPI003865BB26|nr:erythromycin esterase family protein [Streptomyces sp. NBC_01077]